MGCFVCTRSGGCATAAARDLRGEARTANPLHQGNPASSSSRNGSLHKRGENSYLSVLLTRRCPLRCTYCSQQGRASKALDFDLPTLERLLADARRLGFVYVSLTGGEPLCHPAFKEVLELIRDSGLWVFLETNGRLLTLQIARQLGEVARQTTVRVSVSLDSVDPERHDHCRGPGAHAAAVAAIRTLRDEGLTLQVCKAIIPDELTEGWRLDPFLAFCRELGVARVDVGRIVPIGRGDAPRFALAASQIDEVRKQLISREDFATYVDSDDFLLARDAGQCRRLAGSQSGVVVSMRGIQPCSFLPEVILGRPTELESVVTGTLREKLDAVRAAILKDAAPQTVWGCPECRPAFLMFLRQLRDLIS